MTSLSSVSAIAPDSSHEQQATAFWRRWIARRPSPAAAPAVPAAVALPSVVWRHYRHFSWVIYEQRLFALLLAFLFAATALVWTTVWRLRIKPPLVVRAPPSLKESAAAYYQVSEISYDQLAFFLQACVPLLYASGPSGHPLLPLAQGLVAPEIYAAAEERLRQSDAVVTASHLTQQLTLTILSNVVADATSGRAAADLHGYVTVTLPQAAAQFYAWRAHVLLAVNPISRLNPYPFFLLRFEPQIEAKPQESAS